MCGIAGIVQSSPRDHADRALLERMTETLAHRGPDGHGLHVDGPCGLGHRRLSIIDLSTGDQPMFNEDGNLAIVFNGEIYNYRELRPQLKAAGHRFSTTSDTEVILHAYEEHGPRCVDAFVGMFAFAIWDRRRRSLFIARDRLGIKPLYYHLDDKRLLYASELKSLLADERIRRTLAVPALDDYLTYGYVPGDRCIIAGVQKLPPGHWMLWQDGQLRVEKYWDVDLTPDHAADETEWMQRIEAALRRAVRLRLRADVPLGVFLSGGVDSSAVAAFASQESDRPLKTFSIGFDEAGFDELKFARLVAQRYQTESHELIVRDRDIGILSDLAYHLDEPFADPSALPTFYVCREAARFVKVCLSGDGGDETFAGYTRYRQADRYRRIDWLPSAIRRGLGGMLLRCVPEHMWGRGELERLSLSGAARYLAQTARLTTRDRRKLLAAGASAVCDAARIYEPFFARGNPDDLISVLQHIDLKNYLPDDILVKVDRLSMQVALEARVPLLDHKLVEAVNSAPLRMKYRHKGGKYLLKKILSPHLPPEILNRRKKGFGIPIRDWFRGALHDYARELLLSPAARSVQFLERRAMRRIIERHAAGMRDFSRKIWTLLMFEHWCRRYGI
ncbi:MAG: Asparagine synthetase [glutamine-hydrolyzing] 1 [Phycisphaerae bacterium]|nr:Asparagine synthetase [glutamine-hydrolyzing] 1 [Phycisphaerae bacterium]